MLNKKVLSKLLANKSIKALGYSKKELRGIAQQIADNLNSTEETSEEEVDAEIDERIEAVTPFLGFGQSQANRLLDEWKKNNPTPMDDDEDGKGDEPKPANPIKPKEADSVPAWAQALIDGNKALQSEIAAIKGSKLTDQRREKLQALLKNTGVFGERTLKQFSRLKFEDDDDFNDYLADVELDIKALNQERADKGLELLGKPATQREQETTKTKPYSEAEAKEIFG
jgi:hypothetical protein